MSRTVIFGCDFGWTAPSAVVAVVFDNDGRAFVVDEIYQTRLSTSELIERCFKLQDKWGEGTFWCDPSEPETIAAMKRAGLKARPGNRNRDEGIREIGGRLRDAGDGKRRLYVSPACVNLIDELQSYNADRKEHDHAVDALRYLLVGAGKPKREPAWGFGKRGARWR